jgi:hypothetical protein
LNGKTVEENIRIPSEAKGRDRYSHPAEDSDDGMSKISLPI